MLLALWTVVALLAASQPTAAEPTPALRMAPGVILGAYAAPRTALAGDLNGDGRADFIGYYPGGEGILDAACTSALGKLRFGAQAATRAGEDALAVLAAPFVDQRASVLLLLPDGTLRLAHDLQPETTTFARLDPVGAVEAPLPRAPARAVALDADGDGRQDALLADASGRLLLLHNRPDSGALPRFAARPVSERLPELRRLAAGDLDGDGRWEIAWLDRRGRLWRASLALGDGKTVHLQARAVVATGAPGDGLACGRFLGAPGYDLILGQKLLPRGEAAGAIPLPTLPPADQARTDYAWLAADFDGDGKDDLLRAQRSGDPVDGDCLYLHYACTGDAPEDAPFADADQDGLLNAWESGQVKPGGLDLPALGCSPRHRDVLVELQPMPGVPEDRLREEMQRVVAYYAALPIENPDGQPGIALRVLYLPPVPAADAGKPWWELGEQFHARAHRGVTHWMVVYNAGGGQSGEMADRGSCGFHGFYATFIHEFGHQLGLDHSGRWEPAWCPIYPSVMNYAYNYQLNGRGDQIRYSDGRFASLVLDERRLSERLPFPPEAVSFLAGPPYHYRLKPAPGGRETLIDWNWNGVFGEKRVAADINYGYSTTAGLRHIIGKSYTAPALVAHGRGSSARLLLFCGQLPEGVPVPPADASATHPSLCPELPGKLCLRLWTGRDRERDGPRWSDELVVEPAGVTGDPSAIYHQGATWVAFPMRTGVRLRSLRFGPRGKLQVGPAYDVPDSAGTCPTLVSFAGRLGLLLWRTARAPVELRLLAVGRDGVPRVTSVQSLGFTSTVPVGGRGGKPPGRAADTVGGGNARHPRRPPGALPSAPLRAGARRARPPALARVGGR